MYAARSLGITPRVVTKPYVRIAPHSPEGSRKTWAARRHNGTDRHSEATKVRLREATARAIAEGRVPMVSGTEKKVAEVLATLGITAKAQAPIRNPVTGRFGACVDFLLEDGRALEVNGTFWHADPRVYPDGPVKAAQLRTAERWARKVDLLNALGIPLHVVWEQDIRQDARKAVEIALARVGE